MLYFAMDETMTYLPGRVAKPDLRPVKLFFGGLDASWLMPQVP